MARRAERASCRQSVSSSPGLVLPSARAEATLPASPVLSRDPPPSSFVGLALAATRALAPVSPASTATPTSDRRHDAGNQASTSAASEVDSNWASACRPSTSARVLGGIPLGRSANRGIAHTSRGRPGLGRQTQAARPLATRVFLPSPGVDLSIIHHSMLR